MDFSLIKWSCEDEKGDFHRTALKLTVLRSSRPQGWPSLSLARSELTASGYFYEATACGP
ncbi:hypothetical protein IRJ41_021343 [Triplophysa rosa]|uniref:Uncharacterized protein n=1 Tax=Triplophysa rosa TaxID=992332 RepID=A0A9W7TG55_TRIRA|nr:hypothetical protein IRJ41_021343 [Triplophysa rosa]